MHCASKIIFESVEMASSFEMVILTLDGETHVLAMAKTLVFKLSKLRYAFGEASATTKNVAGVSVLQAFPHGSTSIYFPGFFGD